MMTTLRRLRYVTSNYPRLQGLRLVAVGIMMLLAIPVLELDSPWDTGLFAVLTILLGVSLWRIGVYYRRRFGALETRPEQPWVFPVARINLRLVAVLLFVLIAAFFLKLKVLSPGWILGLVFAGLWALEERRWYYLLLAVPFVATAVLYRSAPPDLWAKLCWGLPVGLIVGGILDHRYLVRSLPGAQLNGNA